MTAATAEAPPRHDIRPGIVRCDRCGNRVYIVAEHGDSMLYFCMHHGKKHMQALQDAGWTIFDYTEEV